MIIIEHASENPQIILRIDLRKPLAPSKLGVSRHMSAILGPNSGPAAQVVPRGSCPKRWLRPGKTWAQTRQGK